MIVSTIATIIVATLVRLSTGRRVAAVASTLVVVAALVALRRLLLLTLQRTIRYLLIVDGLKIGGESLERLVVEHLAARYVLRAVVAMVAHVEPLHLQLDAGIGD